MFSHGKLIAFIQYFTPRIQDYWHIIYPIEAVEKKSENKYLYFYDISKKATSKNVRLDQQGVYLFYGYDGLYQYHALEIAQYGLACWVAWAKTDVEFWKNQALIQSDWLVLNQDLNGGFLSTIKNAKYSDLPDRWPSALTQGLAISALLRAYIYTGKEVYKESLKKAVDFLNVDVNEGGVRRKFSSGDAEYFIYEEYPRRKLDGVLNGYISLILAMLELADSGILMESDISGWVKKNIDNLYSLMPMFDSGYYSFYSLNGNISSGFYHRYVVVQLEVLGRIDSRFLEYKNKFIKYRDSFICQLKALKEKLRYLYA